MKAAVQDSDVHRKFRVLFKIRIVAAAVAAVPTALVTKIELLTGFSSCAMIIP